MRTNSPRTTTRTVTDDKPKKVGGNVKALEGWRQRLNSAVGQMPYRAVAERAIGSDGKPLGYTTVRHVFAGPGTTTVETLAAICDAIGVKIGDIIGGEGMLKALPPPGGSIPMSRKVFIIPVVPLPRSHEWADISADPDRYEELYYTDSADSNGLMAARIVDISMVDRYTIGDIVLFRKAVPKKGDDVIVQIHGQGSMLRKWSERSDGKIHLSALNEEFGSQTIARERLNVIGVVSGFARNF